MWDWLGRTFERKRASLHDKLQQSLPKDSSEVLATIYPDHPDWRKLGSQALDDSDLVEAERCYRMALSLTPQDASAHVNLGFVRLELQQVDSAKELLQKAVKIDPNNFDAWYILAGIHELELD